MTDPDVVSGHLLYEHAEVGCLRCASCDYNSSSEVFGKSALADFIEHCLDDLLHAGGDDFREVFHCHLLSLAGCASFDAEHLLAQALKLVRHAGAVCELYVLGKPFSDLELSLDVVCYVSSSERNGSIMSHDVAMVNGNRGASASEVDQCNTVLHLKFRQYCPCCRFSCEILFL